MLEQDGIMTLSHFKLHALIYIGSWAGTFVI